MRVAIVTSCFLDRDGLGNSLRDLAAACESFGWKVHVYHEENEGATVDGFSSHCLQLSDLLSSCAEGKNHPFFDHDLFIVSYLPYYPLMEVCRFIPAGRLLIEYPGITPSHFYPEYDPLKKLTENALKHLSLLDLADGLLVHSEYMKKELLSLHELPEEKIHLLPLAVADHFGPGKGERRPQLLYVGRLTANKRLDMLLEAFVEVRKEHPQTLLTIAGMFERSTAAKYKDTLSQQAKELGLLEAVTFINSPSDDELAKLYKQSSLFVTASQHEGFCIPVAEALSSALPCVVANVAATPETMGQGGLAFEPEKVSSLAKNITKLLSDPAEMEKRRELALEESKRFTLQRFKENVKTIIESVMEGPALAEARSEGVFQLIEAATTSSVRYHDKFQWPIIGSLLRWFRRKATLPLEVSCVRPLAQQQTLWNRLLVQELRQLRGELQELRKRQSEILAKGAKDDK